ncbi:hypothetical protein ES288_A04G047200v1 [Gossypium darwinii]|uniref:RNase III domain-containing protein n=1 Tax=Gossypium darwinii TaxID=34276 RepID=A0A5D2GTY9_GOSDA|nr:hypothetical protein ES288_A04G047200v1 [Gossypium darwinii]
MEPVDMEKDISQLHPADPLPFALTDSLVPDIVFEEHDVEEIEKEPYNDDQPIFFPPELVNKGSLDSMTKYYCYLMELKQNFDYEVPVQNIMLLVRNQFDMDEKSMNIELEVDRGTLTVNMKYIGLKCLNSDQVILCRRFQLAVFQVLMYRKAEKLAEVLCDHTLGNNSEIDYLLLPSNYVGQSPLIDWLSVTSVTFSYEKACKNHVNCNADILIQIKSGLVCTCMIQNSLVTTPHNGHAYIISGLLTNINANSLLRLSDGRLMTYKEYYEKRHGINLCYSQVSFLAGRHIFRVQNHIQRRRKQKEKESSNAFVELPPELCCVVMSPISISTFYSFTFLPSIMHRLESSLLATSLKKMHLNHCVQNVAIPTMKVLEAITTKKCLENFHLESLETLGDSFLKYAVCQQLFKKYQNHQEGLLSIRKEKFISNTALSMLGCDKKLPGFIRNEPFDPKDWTIPGYNCGSYSLNEETLCNAKKIYVTGRRKLKFKKVADVVEALIGAYLSTGGEAAGFLFLDWIGISINFTNIPYERHFKVRAEKFVNVQHFESLLHYSFQDPSLLVEALTHGSYMLAEIPGCYQVLGDVMESLAGAIFVDSGYNKEIVFQSIRPLLEPMITPETLKVHPVKELYELCQRQHYELRKPIVSHEDGISSITIEVEANGKVFKHTSTVCDKKMAKKLASKEVLKSLKGASCS